jgi:hypothetical protein
MSHVQNLARLRRELALTVPAPSSTIAPAGQEALLEEEQSCERLNIRIDYLPVLRIVARLV